MSRPDNPRYPHTCYIYRHSELDPMDDENIEYDPMADETETEEEETADEVTVVYEGECRAYDKNTTSDKGEVITSTRGLSIPVTLDEWEALGIEPQEGDEVVVTRGAVKEYGKVIDKNANTFGGTHIIWRYGRN